MVVNIHGLGIIAEGAGEIVLAVLAQEAARERRHISERTEAGRQAVRASLQATGKTHRGKDSLGRPYAADAAAVREWRKASGASISETARKFGLSAATVKRYCATSVV